MANSFPSLTGEVDVISDAEARLETTTTSMLQRRTTNFNSFNYFLEHQEAVESAIQQEPHFADGSSNRQLSSSRRLRRPSAPAASGTHRVGVAAQVLSRDCRCAPAKRQTSSIHAVSMMMF